MTYDRHGKRYLTDVAAVATAKELNGIRIPTRHCLHCHRPARKAQRRFKSGPAKGERSLDFLDHLSLRYGCLTALMGLLARERRL
jgi:hypothetical protein